MNDRRAKTKVEEEWDADAVEEVPDVAGRRATHVEVRQPRRERDDARERFDDPKRIAECSGHEARFRLRETYGFGLTLLFVNGDVDRLRLRRCLGRRRSCVIGSGAGGCDDWRDERDQ